MDIKLFNKAPTSLNVQNKTPKTKSPKYMMNCSKHENSPKIEEFPFEDQNFKVTNNVKMESGTPLIGL